jgi:hypothetical protein
MPMVTGLVKKHLVIVHIDVSAIQLVKDVMQVSIKTMEVNYGTAKAPLWRKIFHVTQWNTLPTRPVRNR